MHTSNTKILVYQSEPIICLVKFYSDNNMIQQFYEDNLKELLIKNNEFIKNNSYQFKYETYIDFYFKLFPYIGIFKSDCK
jgi:hypothetical protein